ncbi:DNA methyltransferase, partial [bacterium]|nr:DNA methyltransferase [bacterium]
MYSNGGITARDTWVYDFNIGDLKAKVKSFIETYNREQNRWDASKSNRQIKDFVERSIKWSDELLDHLDKGTKLNYDESKIRKSLFRPFTSCYQYVDRVIIHRFGQMHHIFPNGDSENKIIAFSFNSTDFAALASNRFFDFALLKFANGSTQCLPLYRYTENGERIENITDWGLAQFREHYGRSRHAELVSASQKSTNKETLKRVQGDITKEGIFHYVYAVLHNPAYRKKYELNLKREFPRLPFYKDFWKWVAWGKA